MNTIELRDQLIAGILNDTITEAKVGLILKVIEKFNRLALKAASVSLDKQAAKEEHKAEVIATEEEAKEMLQNGATVRETQEATGLSYRKTAKISAEVHKQEDIPVRQTIPTRPTKPIADDNNSDNGNDNKNDNNSDNENDNKPNENEHKETEIMAQEAIKPDNRTDEEKQAGMNGFYDISDPDGKKAEILIDKAQELLGTDEYEVMRNAYNKPETYDRLCQLWDYMHNERPNEWVARPDMEKPNKPALEVATYSTDSEKAIAMKRLAGLTGLKRAAMAATIDRYFNDKELFQEAYKDDPNMKFAYTLDDYINGSRYNRTN